MYRVEYRAYSTRRKCGGWNFKAWTLALCSTLRRENKKRKRTERRDIKVPLSDHRMCRWQRAEPESGIEFFVFYALSYQDVNQTKKKRAKKKERGGNRE
ncbi:hypothetical protein VTO42DRAFT_2799 [Malbranchea cinnamomea]